MHDRGKHIDIETSLRIARGISAQPRECFRNAYLAVVEPAWVPDSVYVEGYAADQDIPLVLRHGWIETPTTIIDPTWVLIDGLTSGRADWYVPARTWTAATLPMPQHGVVFTLPVVRYDWRNLHYAAASDELYRRIYGKTPVEMQQKRQEIQKKYG